LKPQVNIGIIGFGTVGTGVVRLLLEHQEQISKKAGIRIEIKRICDLDITRERPVKIHRNLLTTSAAHVLDDPEIDIVAELIGGVDPAKEFILRALRNGKHVVTANKELIAREGKALLTEADARKLDLFFEASVGGGIPIIRPLRVCLAGNELSEVIGIVNGTTNYILTKMSREGGDFEGALGEAQKAGYAEADPTNDIDGLDARYKIAILASIAFGASLDVDQVYAEGIRKVTSRDIEYARQLGYVIKLLGIARSHDNAIEARVHPTLLPSTHPLAGVNDVYNAIYVRGDFVQDVMFYGRGAGSMPTASAVVGDIIDIARNVKASANGRLPVPFMESKDLEGIDSVITRYYVRMLVADRPGVLAAIAKVFGDNQVSIASVVQKDSQGAKAEIVLITHAVAERNFRQAINEIQNLDVVAEIGNWIRVEE